MTVTAQTPAAGVFGYEVADDISENKNLLQQSVAALTANGVPVTLPGAGTFQSPGLSTTDGRAGDPISMERELVNNLMAAIAGIGSVKASLVLVSSAPANVLALTALNPGNYGNGIVVTVAAGTSSGKKITIAAPGFTTEVYDNTVDTGAAFVAAIQGVSLIVSAALTGATGSLVPANLAATNLASGVGAPVTPPSYPTLGENGAAGAVALNDGASQSVDAWGNAIFAALRFNGYIA